MNLTTALLLLVAWLFISSIIAWGVGKAADLGQTARSSLHASQGNERRKQTDRRCERDRRNQVERRTIQRECYERRITDRRLLQRRLEWAT